MTELEKIVCETEIKKKEDEIYRLRQEINFWSNYDAQNSEGQNDGHFELISEKEEKIKLLNEEKSFLTNKLQEKN